MTKSPESAPKITINGNNTIVQSAENSTVGIIRVVNGGDVTINNLRITSEKTVSRPYRNTTVIIGEPGSKLTLNSISISGSRTGTVSGRSSADMDGAIVVRGNNSRPSSLIISYSSIHDNYMSGCVISTLDTVNFTMINSSVYNNTGVNGGGICFSSVYEKTPL